MDLRLSDLEGRLKAMDGAALRLRRSQPSEAVSEEDLVQPGAGERFLRLRGTSQGQ